MLMAGELVLEIVVANPPTRGPEADVMVEIGKTMQTPPNVCCKRTSFQRVVIQLF
jgi:hypothetical protein